MGGWMIKKIILSIVLVTLLGCTSRTRLIPKAEIKRVYNSKFAIVSVEYAGELGIDVIIQNKLGKIVEILWDKSRINNENIALAETPYEDLYKKIKNDFLVPNIPYRRVIYPLSNVKGPNDFFKLSYPIKLEIFFRRGDTIDKSILIIREGELIEKKVNFAGQVIN